MADSTSSLCIFLSPQTKMRVKGGPFMDQMKTGRFIAQCRKEKGLTQFQLGEKLGVTDRAVSKWERGDSLR